MTDQAGVVGSIIIPAFEQAIKGMDKKRWTPEVELDAALVKYYRIFSKDKKVRQFIELLNTEFDKNLSYDQVSKHAAQLGLTGAVDDR